MLNCLISQLIIIVYELSTSNFLLRRKQKTLVRILLKGKALILLVLVLSC